VAKSKKKNIQRNFNLVIVVFGFLFVTVFIQQFFQNQTSEKQPAIVQKRISNSVEYYMPVLREELKNVNLEQYTVVLAAIMEQESRGEGGDPMQASESAGLPPNTIKDPNKSIAQGVKHFQATLTYGNEKNVDFQTIIQAYNMGRGYIDFISQRGGKHSIELAKEFSSIQVDKNPAVYNCGGDQSNFRYPYCYGDFSYTTKVTANIETLTATNPELPNLRVEL